jgi:hypothetical protein
MWVYALPGLGKPLMVLDQGVTPLLFLLGLKTSSTGLANLARPNTAPPLTPHGDWRMWYSRCWCFTLAFTKFLPKSFLNAPCAAHLWQATSAGSASAGGRWMAGRPNTERALKDCSNCVRSTLISMGSHLMSS